MGWPKADVGRRGDIVGGYSAFWLGKAQSQPVARGKGLYPPALPVWGQAGCVNARMRRSFSAHARTHARTLLHTRTEHAVSTLPASVLPSGSLLSGALWRTSHRLWDTVGYGGISWDTAEPPCTEKAGVSGGNKKPRGHARLIRQPDRLRSAALQSPAPASALAVVG
jgi:hypothetical protein